MGPPHSKEEKKEEKVAVVDASTDVHETSSGMHFVEIHAPTGGMTVTVVAVAVGLWYGMRRYMRRRQRKKDEKKEAEARDAIGDVEAVVDQKLLRLQRMYEARAGFHRVPDGDRFEEVWEDARDHPPPAPARTRGLSVVPDKSSGEPMLEGQTALVAAAAAAAAAAVAQQRTE